MAYSSCRGKGHLYYWHREAKFSNAEVDYIIESEGKVIPIEVKSGLRGTIKSLNKVIVLQRISTRKPVMSGLHPCIR